MKSIFFISTNRASGGSELLWQQTALSLRMRGHDVNIAIHYDSDFGPNCDSSSIRRIDLRQRFPAFSIPGRIGRKLGLSTGPQRDLLQDALLRSAPDLVVISQGNNIDGLQYMELLLELKIPYVTLTHLVAECFWPSLNDSLLIRYRLAYKSALMNYFVSKESIILHETMMGESFTNTGLVFNPVLSGFAPNSKWPALLNDCWQIALVGRIEFFHKGLDLFLEVVKGRKWQERNVQFSLVGSGPHSALFKQLLKKYQIENVSLPGSVEDIDAVWNAHHALLMTSRMEGRSIALVEAMYFNRPVFSTPVAGTGGLVLDNETGFLAGGISPEAIDVMLEVAWQQRDNWQSMGEQAGKLIRKTQPEDPIEHFIRLLIH